MKRGVIRLSFVFLVSILVINLFSMIVVAQDGAVDNSDGVSDVEEEKEDEEEPEDVGEVGEEVEEEQEKTEEEDFELENEEDFENSELEAGAGITPDSAFYFVDELFDNFGDDLSNREEKVAEIRAMVEAGNMGAARKALEKYKGYAEKLGREVDPDERNEARRSAVAIKRTLRNLEDKIPEGEREEFVDDVLDRERKIETAVEIASKIKELCVTLSKLDPVEYSRICRTEDNTPMWKMDLDKKLTKEQEKEAKEFFNIMSQCFKGSGAGCRCEDISVPAFAEKCAVIAPLATSCDAGNEKACEKMEEIEDDEPISDLLPPHLQDVLFKLEDKYEGDRMDMHMPRECVEAGVKNPKECGIVMFKFHAPEECIEALERGEIDPSNKRKAREACDEIMFKADAPEECIEAGLKDPKACGALMFKQHAPEECIEAGLTGESRSDDRKCKELMDGKREEFDRPMEGFGGDCAGIKDSNERLRCYDKANSGVGDHFEKKGRCQTPEQIQRLKQECKEIGEGARVEDRGGCPWVLCVSESDNYIDKGRDYVDNDNDYDGPRDDNDYDYGGVDLGPDGIVGYRVNEPRDDDAPSDSGGDSGSSGGGDGGSSDSGSNDGGGDSGSDSGSSEGDSGGGDSGGGITGGVIYDFEGNGFLDYFFR